MMHKRQTIISCLCLMSYSGFALSDTKGKTAPPVFGKSLSSNKISSTVPKGKITQVTFDKALPEDISNENFPDRIDSFDFPNANLLDLVKAISKLTKINFIVDPNLKSKKISIISPSSITVAEAYKAFLSALAANNYTVVKSGAFWKIKKSEDAHSDNIEVYSGDYFPNTDQLITRIIKLKHINAKNFSTSIKWLLSKENKDRISAYEGSNSIILSDYGSVIERIMKIVYEMDVPGSEETVEIIPIQHASAEELAGLLMDLLSISKSSSRSAFNRPGRGKSRIALSPNVKKSPSGNVQISTIVSDSRTNSLVVSANESGLERVYELVQKLDTPVDASRTGGVYVYNVLYGTAEEIYNTLMGIKPSSNQSQGQNRQDIFSQSKRSQSRPFSSFGRRANNSPLFDENVGILSDTNTNSLIISAKSKYDYERVLSVLKKIDVPRDQVFIQAIIVEMLVSKEDSREFNLAGSMGKLLENSFLSEIGFKNILGSSIAGFLSQSFGLGNLKPAGIGPGLILSTPLSSLLSASQGVSWSPIDSLSEEEQGDAVARRDRMTAQENRLLRYSQIPLLRMLKTAANINILSTPQLTTLDNVKAFIEVGENAPVGLTSTATAGALAQNSIDREDITLRLDILPRINPESGTVQMDITQKFDDFSDRNPTASELAARSVNIVKREIETKMVLNDGETAVLGGLLTDKEIQKDNKVPLLGDLPVIGWLFKGSAVQKEKRNLMVFITPTIIKGEIHREKTREILGKKLEERIQFIKQNAKGVDPHGIALKKLIPESKSFLDNNKKDEFEQGSMPTPPPIPVDEIEEAPHADEEDLQEIEYEEEDSPALLEEDSSWSELVDEEEESIDDSLEPAEVEDFDSHSVPASPENF